MLIYSNNAFGQCPTVETFTTGTGTFTVPNGVTSITIQTWGGGGRGSSRTTDGGGGGGGGGSFSQSTIAVTPGQPYNYSVGGGSTTTAAGENSWFSITNEGAAIVRALGGSSVNNGTALAAGGALGTGTIGFIGGSGANGIATGAAAGRIGGGGGGGAGPLGAGGNAVGRFGGSNGNGGGDGGTAPNSTDTNGIDGIVIGGGGSGSARNGTNRNGGAGARGQITITYSIPANTVTPAPVISPVCVNSPLTSFTHTTTGATGIANNGIAGANGLPAGISATWASNTITISGTPSVSGTFNYSIPMTGGCVINALPATGTITVTANNTAGTISSNIFCALSPLPGGVTQATTGATGINAVGATGLPPGVTIAWAANQITFSGTPTTPGTYIYSIPMTGGCGVVNATGTITINQVPAISGFTALGGTTCLNITSFGAMSVGTGFGYTYEWFSNDTPDYTTPTSTGVTTNTYPPPINVAGTTFYFVRVSSSSCTSIDSPVSGAYVVNPTNTVTPASASPVVCINPAVPISITHTTTGASGIGAWTGLPAGVTAAWSADEITISGTPTESGIFNYSIPLTGGCGTVNATGTITVNAEAAILTPSLAAQTRCLNDVIPFAQISVGTGQGFAYQWYENTANNNTTGTPISLNGTSNTYTPLSSSDGTTYYYVEVTSATCGATPAKSLPSGAFIVNPLPIVSFVSQPAVGNYCVDTDITYSTQSGQSNYVWTIPGVLGTDYTITSGGTLASNTVEIRWLTAGSKSISVNYTDPNGCGTPTAATSNSITVQKNTVTVSSDPNPSSCYYDRAITTFTHTTTLATGIGTPIGLPLGISATWAGGIITISGTVDASVFSGVYPYSIPLTGGCGNVAATGFIDVQPEYTLSKITSVSPSNTGGNATITLTGNPSAFANGAYVVNYQMGLANPLSATNATVNFVNGVGTFFSSPINNESLTSLTINSIKKVTDRCPVDIIANNITFFGIQPKIFATNGTFYVPAGIFQITIKVYAGGGGGGRGSNGAGGGGGGYSERTINVIPGEPIGIFVGNGGAGQTGAPAAGNGGPSYVTRDSSDPDPVSSSIAYAYGGIGANGGTLGIGGIGQTTNGNQGNVPTAGAGGQGGKGGGVDGGVGGAGGVSGSAAARRGRIGTPFGGGGGGSHSNADGGNGASGYVVITYPLPPVDPCFVVIDDGSVSGTTIIEYTCDETWEAPEGLAEFTVLVGSGGGGGGSGEGSGGGGSGAVISQLFTTTNPYGLPPGSNFNIVVGAGGLGAVGTSSNGVDGETSIFSGNIDGAPINIIVPGGGGGGSQSSQPGASGASGGGGGASRDNPLTPQSSGVGGSSISITYSGPFIFVYQGNEGGNGDAVDVPNKDAAIAGGGGGGLIPWKLPPSNDGQNGKAAGLGQGEGGRGGDAVTLTLGDSIRYYGAGGGGIGEYFNGTEKIGEGGSANGIRIGGSGNLDIINTDGKGLPGKDKTGSGGGAGYHGGGKGGNGVVYITYNVFRILPVEFLYFNAIYQNSNRSGDLKWATAQEWETSHFEIERSVNDTRNWTKVGEVTSKGYSDVPVEYSFTDHSLPASGGNIFYRLKQVDLKGDFQYSATRAIKVNPIGGSTGWLVYPNPTTGYPLEIGLLDSKVYRDEPITVRIISTTGTYDVIESTSVNTISGQISDWLLSRPSGVYTLEISWGIHREYHKVILRK